MDNNQNYQESSNPQGSQNYGQKPRTEEFTINGDQVVAKVKELIHEGDIRQITIKTEEGKVLLQIPLTIGVAGATAAVILAPVFAAIGALAAIVARLTIVIERTGEPKA
jgi:hypothetical protein